MWLSRSVCVYISVHVCVFSWPWSPCSLGGELMFLTLLVNKISSPVGPLHILQACCQWEEVWQLGPSTNPLKCVGESEGCFVACVCVCVAIEGLKESGRMCVLEQKQKGKSAGGSAQPASTAACVCMYVRYVCMDVCLVSERAHAELWTVLTSRPGSSASVFSTLSLSFIPILNLPHSSSLCLSHCPFIAHFHLTKWKTMHQKGPLLSLFSLHMWSSFSLFFLPIKSTAYTVVYSWNSQRFCSSLQLYTYTPDNVHNVRAVFKASSPPPKSPKKS